MDAGEPPMSGGHPVAEVKPLDVTGVRTMLVGTLLWLVAAVVLFLVRGRLEADGHLWWLWTSLVAASLGVFGVDHCRRRARRLGERVPLEDRLRRHR